jgi:hypothetical protein
MSKRVPLHFGVLKILCMPFMSDELGMNVLIHMLVRVD